MRQWRVALCFITVFFSGLAMAENTARNWPFPDVPTNSEVLLKDDWRFASDPEDKGMEKGWFEPAYSRADWRSADVPGVWGDLKGEPPRVAEKKVGWYARDVALSEEAEGAPALVFLGSMFVTDVWIEGEYLGNNRGGYTPFLFSLDEHLAPGEKKTLVVRVDNRLDGQTIPKAGTGWNTYGGLTREVYLITRPRCRVENLQTATEVHGSGPEAPVRFKVSGDVVNLTNEKFGNSLKIELKANEDNVAEDEVEVFVPPGEHRSFEVVIDLNEARLWSPEDPFLHDLVLRWKGTEGAHIEMPVGLREISVDGAHFKLNGERLWLQGFGQHEMAPGYGACVPPGWHEEKLTRMKTFGANHYRAGHYPQHPDLYRAADRIGLLVFTEIPAWQINSNWLETDNAWDKWAEPQISAMIRWYRNFPSVVSWGGANETNGTPNYNRRVADYVTEKDPTRLPMIVLASTTGNLQRYYDLLPMGGRNFHYGWYHSKRVYGARSGLASNLKHAERANVPIWVSELGGKAPPGRFSGAYNDHSKGSETYLDKIVRFGFQHHPTATDRVCGITIWTWSDFVRNDKINRHGIFGYKGVPKLVAYTVRNLFAEDLRLYLTEQDTSCNPGGEFSTDAFIFNPALRSVPDDSTVDWRVMKGDKTEDKGNLEAPGGQARTMKAGQIKWQIPDDAEGMYSLWAELVNKNGQTVYTNAVHFGVKKNGDAAETPGVLRLEVENDGESVAAEAELGGVKVPIYKDPGLYVPLRAGEYELTITYEGKSETIDASVEAGERIRKTVEF